MGKAAAGIAAVALVGLLTAGLRYVTLATGFPNDHYLHLAGAQQMVFGEWPTRDFQDPGLPLMYALSAAAQLAGEAPLVAEGVLVALAFALAAALTMWTVHELTGSWVLALFGAVIEVAAFPRTYSYPKVLVYSAGCLLLVRYAARPGPARAAALGLMIGTAFLFRHDYGLVMTIGAMAAIALNPAHDGSRARQRAAVMCAAVAGALVGGYLLYVQVHGGAVAYLRTAIEFSAREAGRQGHVWPSLFDAERVTEAVRVYLSHAIPVAATVTALAMRQRGEPRAAAAVLPIAIVGGLVAWTLIRDPLAARLPDAVVPTAVLGPWLIARVLQAAAARLPPVPLAVVRAATIAAAAVLLGATVALIDRAGLMMSVSETRERIGHVTRILRTPASSRALMPSESAEHLMPFIEYVQRCTTADQRLLVTGFLPEIPVFAGRPFAGGQSTFVSGYYGSAANQRLVLERLRQHDTPFALVPNDYGSELETAFPMLAAYLRERYLPMATVGDEGAQVAILVDRTVRPASRDEETGWPCFVN